MTKPRRFSVNRVVGVMAVLSLVVLFIRPWDTPEVRAYRTCADCGFSEGETGKLIATIREAGLTREQAMELWRETAEPLAVEECTPCAEAIADVACEPYPCVV